MEAIGAMELLQETYSPRGPGHAERERFGLGAISPAVRQDLAGYERAIARRLEAIGGARYALTQPATFLARFDKEVLVEIDGATDLSRTSSSRTCRSVTRSSSVLATSGPDHRCRGGRSSRAVRRGPRRGDRTAGRSAVGKLELAKVPLTRAFRTAAAMQRTDETIWAGAALPVMTTASSVTNIDHVS